jgi:hypothetical protein
MLLLCSQRRFSRLTSGQRVLRAAVLRSRRFLCAPRAKPDNVEPAQPWDEEESSKKDTKSGKKEHSGTKKEASGSKDKEKEKDKDEGIEEKGKAQQQPQQETTTSQVSEPPGQVPKPYLKSCVPDPACLCFEVRACWLREPTGC